MCQMGYSGKDIISTRLYCDNQGCIALGDNPELHQRTKHIDIKHHFIREHIACGRVSPRYISTKEMVADGLTKPLNKAKHEMFVKLLNMKTVEFEDGNL